MEFKKLNEVDSSESLNTFLGVKDGQIVQMSSDNVKANGVSKPYVIDSEAYTYGDDALQAILEGRQLYVKVPNVDGGSKYSNFMPVLQYQLPNENNDYLTLFYLKDGIANNLVTGLTKMMQGDMSGMANIYGEITMLLSQSYSECPLKVDPVK
jgi:hypothetical protein